MNDNRSRLTKAAQEIVQRNGFKGLSFRTLANEIGIKSSSVHYHFPEKSDLAQELIEQYSEHLALELDEIAAKPISLKRKISSFIKIFEMVAKADNLCLCGMMAAEVGELNQSNQQYLRDFFLMLERWIVVQIEAQPDELKTQMAPSQLAKTMLSGLEGALLVDRVVGNHQRLNAQKELYLALFK